MYMGNLALLVLNLPLVGLWVQVLKIPSKLLLPLILLICLAGVYTINNNVTDIVVMTIFGVAGYIGTPYNGSCSRTVNGDELA